MTRARNSANLASHGNLFVDITNDRTGIGSVVPDQNLHVAGTAGFHDDVTFTGDLYNTTWDRSANTLQFANNSILKLGQGSYATTFVNNINTTIEHSPISALFVKTCDFQISGSGNRSGSVYDNAIFRARTGIVELGFEPAGGSSSFKLGTTAYGVNVTGTTDTDGLIVSGVATVATMNVTGVLTYDDVTSVDSIGIVTAREGVFIPDNKELKIGNTASSPDFKIYHDTSITRIRTAQQLVIEKPDSTDIANFFPDGAVSLKHSGNEKFATSSTGVSITGIINGATQLNLSSTGGDLINLSSSNVASRSTIKFNTNGNDWEIGARGSSGSPNNAFYFFDNANSKYRMVIDSSGRLLVGENHTAASNNSIAEFHRDIGGGAEGCHILVKNTSTNSVNNTARLKLETSGGTAQFYAFATGITELRSRVGGTADWKIRADGAASTRFFTNGNERMTIDSSGRVLIGHNSTIGVDIHHAALQVNGDNYNESTISIISNSSNSNGAYLFFAKQRSGSAGGTTIVQDGDTIGQLRFLGMDGADYDNPAATIEVNCDGTPGSNDIPGRIKFSTGDGGSLTERVRIDHQGQMGLGVTPSTGWPSNGDFRALQIGTGIAVFGRGSGDEDRGGISANYYHTGSAGKYIGNGHAGRIYFEDGSIVFSNATSNSSGANAALTLLHRMIIDPDGDVLVGGHTAPLSTYQSSQPRLSIYKSSGSGGYLELGGNLPHNTHSSGTILFINNNNSEATSNNANGKILAMQRVENVTSDTNAGDDMGGDLVFMTKPEAGTLAERIRITSDGNIEVKGTRAGALQTNDDDALKLFTKSTSDDINRGVGITFYTHDGSGFEMGGTIQVAKETGNTNDAKSYMRFSTQTGSTTTEAVRITSGGDVSIGGRDQALNNYAAGSTTTKLAVVEQSGGSGYSEVAHFTAGTDSNDTGAIVRITQFNNDRGMFIKAGRGTSDQAKAIIGLRNSSAVDGNWITLTQNTDQIDFHKNVRIDDNSLAIGDPSSVVARISIKGTNNNGSSAYSPNNAGGKAAQGIDLTCTTVGDDGLGGAISFGCGGNGRSAISGYQDGNDDDRNGLVFYTHDSVNGADAATEKLRIYPTMGVSMQTNNTSTTSGNGNGVGYGVRTRIYPYWVSDTGACRFNITMHPSITVATPQFWVFTNHVTNLTGSVEIGANNRTNAPNNAVQRYHHSKWNVGMYGEGDNDFSGSRWRDSQMTQRGNTIDTNAGYYYVHTSHSEYNTNANQYQNQYGGWYWHLDNGSYWQGQPVYFDMYFTNGGTGTWYAYIND